MWCFRVKRRLPQGWVARKAAPAIPLSSPLCTRVWAHVVFTFVDMISRTDDWMSGSVMRLMWPLRTGSKIEQYAFRDRCVYLLHCSYASKLCIEKVLAMEARDFSGFGRNILGIFKTICFRFNYFSSMVGRGGGGKMKMPV